MGFMNTYSLHSTATDTSYVWNKKILEFFGFKVRKTSSSSVETYGGNTYATPQSDGSFKIETTPTGLYNRTRYYVEYYRDKQPTAKEQALEDRFVALMEQKHIDWTNAPYVEPSLHAYHGNKYKTKNAVVLKMIAFVLAIVGLVFFLGTSAFQATRGIMPVESGPQAALFNSLGAMDPMVATVGAAAAWIAAVVVLIVASNVKRKYRDTPYHCLSFAEQNAIREQYHASLRAAYAGEMGDILVEYAKLQEK